MAIYLSQAKNSGNFVTPQEIRTKTIDGKELYVVSGVVSIHIDGTPPNSGHWRREELYITPSITHPPEKQLRIEQSAVLISLNAIGNANHAVNAGWAVDSCRLSSSIASGGVSLLADIAIRDTDGILYRIGYYATLIAVFEDLPPLE